jgi:hypothetical protein
MQTYKIFLSSLLLLTFLAGCASPTQSASMSDETIPSWVGTPASGNPPRSEKPLPTGVKNGDIVLGQDNLFYFIWENTKSRIWFPKTVEGEEIRSLPDGSDTNFHLVGVTKPDTSLGYLVIAAKGNVNWLDLVRGVKYSFKTVPLPYEELNSIPTAYGKQYFPTYK